MSELTIGLSIVAIGTGLPELAASTMAAFRGEHDMAIGNVIGSNLFNLLAVLAFPAFLSPGVVDPMVGIRDYPAVASFTLALALFPLFGARRLGRRFGVLFVAAYLAYLLSLSVGT